MAKYVYPAIFTPAEEGGYVVTFPDWEGATQGEDKADAIDMANDWMNMTCWSAEHEGKSFSEPTPVESIKAPEGGFVNLCLADTVAYNEVVERENNPIKYARRKAGLNIKGLADLLGAPYRTVQEWNAGRQMPPQWVQRLVLEKINATI